MGRWMAAVAAGTRLLYWSSLPRSDASAHHQCIDAHVGKDSARRAFAVPLSRFHAPSRWRSNLHRRRDQIDLLRRSAISLLIGASARTVSAATVRPAARQSRQSAIRNLAEPPSAIRSAHGGKIVESAALRRHPPLPTTARMRAADDAALRPARRLALVGLRQAALIRFATRS